MASSMAYNSNPVKEGDISSVCVECGEVNSKHIYKEYSGGSVQLLQCDVCNEFLDKYCEFDGVLLILDVFLLRLQAYRHLIFNYNLSNSVSWRLVVALILCGAYINSRFIPPDANNFIHLQLNFHLSLVQSIIEFVCTVLLTLITLSLFRSNTVNASFVHIIKSIIVSSYAKFFAVIAFIWVDEFYINFLLFLTIPAQMKSYQALFVSHSIMMILTAVIGQSILLHAINIALANTKLATFDYLQNQIAIN